MPVFLMTYSLIAFLVRPDKLNALADLYNLHLILCILYAFVMKRFLEVVASLLYIYTTCINVDKSIHIYHPNKIDSFPACFH